MGGIDVELQVLRVLDRGGRLVCGLWLAWAVHPLRRAKPWTVGANVIADLRDLGHIKEDHYGMSITTEGKARVEESRREK